MENQVQVFNSDGAEVRGYVDEKGTAWISAEDAARGLGFIQVKKDRVPTSGDSPYTAIRWERVNGYLKEFGYGQEVDKDDYIPENMFYRLAMKANNEAAEKFQAKVADEIIPSIRKHGMYATPVTLDTLLSDPDTAIRLFTELKKEREERARLTEENLLLNQQVTEMEPKATYYDVVLQCPEVVPITIIAKDYGMSGAKLNKILNQLGVQYKPSDIWILYQQYAELGWTQTKTHKVEDNKGEKHAFTHTYWTQKGRLGLYELLKNHGYVPLIEQEEE